MCACVCVCVFVCVFAVLGVYLGTCKSARVYACVPVRARMRVTRTQVYALDLERRQWLDVRTEARPPPDGRWGHKLAALGNELLLCGG